MSKPISKQALYSKLSCHAVEAVEKVVKLTQSNNENISLGACKLLLNKIIPDMRVLRVDELEEIEKRRNSRQQRNIDQIQGVDKPYRELT